MCYKDKMCLFGGVTSVKPGANEPFQSLLNAGPDLLRSLGMCGLCVAGAVTLCTADRDGAPRRLVVTSRRCFEASFKMACQHLEVQCWFVSVSLDRAEGTPSLRAAP